MGNTFGSTPAGKQTYDPGSGFMKGEDGTLWKTNLNGTMTRMTFNPKDGGSYDPGETYTPSGKNDDVWSLGGDPSAQTVTPAAAAPAGGADPNGPVLQPGQAIPGAEGMDLTKRGPVEQAWQEHGGQYWQPGNQDAFHKALTDQYGVAGENAPKVSNEAAGAYQDFKNGPTNAGLDPYYQNAKRTAGEDIDKRLSSRGLYGSSAADNAIQEAMTNLNAEQANRSADFDLRRAALGGQLATGADSSSGASDAAHRAWVTGIGQSAGSTDTGDINRLNSGFNAAGAAQGAQMGRQGQAFNEEFSMGKALSDILGTGTQQMTDTDKGVQGDAIGTSLGADANAANAQQGHANERNTSTDNMVSTTAGGLKTSIPLIPTKTEAAPSGGTAPAWQSNPGAQYPTTTAPTYNGASAEPWNHY